MRTLQKLGVGITLVGLLLVMAGGMHIRGGPDGTWVQLNLVHGLGGIAIFIGTFFSLISIARKSSN
jgi:hypothetical protein